MRKKTETKKNTFDPIRNKELIEVLQQKKENSLYKLITKRTKTI